MVLRRQKNSKQQHAASWLPRPNLSKHWSKSTRSLLDKDQDAILANGYKWGDRSADIEIQEKWPGAPRHV